MSARTRGSRPGWTAVLSLFVTAAAQGGLGCSSGSSPERDVPQDGVGTGGGDGVGGSETEDPGASGGTSSGGGTSVGGSGGGAGGRPPVTPGSYALPPPDQCINRYFVDGCEVGNPDSTCGGLCTPPSAGHDEGKPGEWGYACPRFMWAADEMRQAARDDASAYAWSDDGTAPFEYAVAGHDHDGGVLDTGGKSVCCQCYQLVPYGPHQENQVMDGGVLQVPLPKPLVVQVFNTGATTTSFDLFLGAGGIGAVNACMDPTAGGPAFYDAYSSVGQPWSGGVKAAGSPGDGTACKNAQNLVSTATLSSAGCTGWVEESCNGIAHEQSWITEATRRSCIESNEPESLYHLNWAVYAKRVACPAGLTQVTGCKIVEDLPEVDPAVTTPEQAVAAGFVTGYHTTTMQDCAKPTCAATDKVTGEGHTAEGLYNAFYTCDRQGVPWTESSGQ